MSQARPSEVGTCAHILSFSGGASGIFDPVGFTTWCVSRVPPIYQPLTRIWADYGGTLPLLSQLEDPLGAFPAASSELTTAENPANPSPTSSADDQSPSVKRISRVESILPTSHLNPYFGYPVSGRGAPTPRLRHGRQRKRDLLRTLAGLWWAKWKDRVILLFCVSIVILSFRFRRHPRVLNWRAAVRGFLRLPSRP